MKYFKKAETVQSKTKSTNITNNMQADYYNKLNAFNVITANL